MNRNTLVGALLAVVVAFLVGRGSHAQRGEAEFFPSPLDRKELAKAKFELQFAKLEDIARAKLAAVQEEFGERRKEFLAGRGTLDFLYGAAARMLEAELAVNDTPAGRVAAHEKHWQAMREVELVDRARFEAGRIPITDYAASRYYRLDAEYQLVKVRAQLKKE